MKKYLVLALVLMFAVTIAACVSPAPTPPQPTATAVDVSTAAEGTLIVDTWATGSFKDVPLGEPKTPNANGWFVYRESAGNTAVIIKNASDKSKVILASATMVQKQYGSTWQTFPNPPQFVTIQIKGELTRVAFKGLGTVNPQFAP